MYLEGIWDWAILKGCFGNTKISPTDIDGLVERHGHILIFETKKPGVRINQGQIITFNALNTLGCTIVILWGEQNMPEEMEILYPPPWRPKLRHKCTIDDLRNFVKKWFEYADKNNKSGFAPNEIDNEIYKTIQNKGQAEKEKKLHMVKCLSKIKISKPKKILSGKHIQLSLFN